METLKDAVNESGQTQLNTHYAYAAELEKALEKGLTLTLHDGGTMNYADAKRRVITVTYYSGVNGTGSTVTANDPSTRVRSFTIQINKADDNPVRRVEVKDLPTHEDQSNVPTGEKWTYKNRVSIQGSSQRLRQRTPTTATRALKNGCRRTAIRTNLVTKAETRPTSTVNSTAKTSTISWWCRPLRG